MNENFIVDGSILGEFDKFLGSQGQKFKASIVGGTAIKLLALETRSTGDLDSLTKIPEDIKRSIREFSVNQDIPKDWFNDNVRRIAEISRVNGNFFSRVIYEGEYLTLYSPENSILLFSKFLPMLDRPGQGDFDDIISLIESNVIGKDDYISALKEFKIRMQSSGDLDLVEALVNELESQIDDLFQNQESSSVNQEARATLDGVNTIIHSLKCKKCGNPAVFREGFLPKRFKKQYCSRCFKLTS